MVGDPAQTIYSFAGANADYLLRLPASATRHHLRRAGPQLPLHARGGRGGQPAARRLAPAPGCGCGPSRSTGARGPVYRATPTRSPRPSAVAAQIQALRRAGTPLGEIAVLFRINAQSEAFEEALAARGVPYVVRGAARFFERAEVRQALTLLRGSARGGRGSGDGLVADVTAVLAGMGWTAEPPDRAGQRAGPLGVPAGARRRRPSDSPPGSPTAGLADFVAELDRRAAEQHAPVAEGVTLATLHAAKGLEWDAVFLCGMHEGTHADRLRRRRRPRSRRSAGCSTSA